MSKENDKKFVEIEDPLADFGMDTEDAAESEEIIGGADEVQTNEIEPASAKKHDIADTFAKIRSKTAEILAPVKKTAEINLPGRTALTAVCCIFAVALIAAILIFTLFSGATYTSGKTVEQWADEWNSVSFTDKATYSVYSSYQGSAFMETMFVSDTDHVYITKDDVKALSKGDTVKLFDDMAELSIETHKGEFKSAHMKIDYNNLCKNYWGEGYEYNSYLYSPGFFDDSTFRTLGCIAMFVNPCNDTANTENEILTEAMDLYLRNGAAYTYDNGNRMDVGDYTFMIYYTYEDFLVVTSASDLSGSDISASDVSASDVIADDMHASVEQHLIVNLTCTHRKAGEKKHAADWSWWNEIFPKKEKTDDVLPEAFPESGSDISGSDTSASDISAADIE